MTRTKDSYSHAWQVERHRASSSSAEIAITFPYIPTPWESVLIVLVKPYDMQAKNGLNI